MGPNRSYAQMAGSLLLDRFAKLIQFMTKKAVASGWIPR